jgi:hypothetical protein
MGSKKLEAKNVSYTFKKLNRTTLFSNKVLKSGGNSGILWNHEKK